MAKSYSKTLMYLTRLKNTRSLILQANSFCLQFCRPATICKERYKPDICSICFITPYFLNQICTSFYVKIVLTYQKYNRMDNVRTLVLQYSKMKIVVFLNKKRNYNRTTVKIKPRILWRICSSCLITLAINFFI